MSGNGAEAFLNLHNISRCYRQGDSRQQVLHDLNGTIQRGEILALLGRSGCGKSTLLNIIGGIDQPTSGSIRIDGVDLTGLDEHSRTMFRRHHIGFVYQFFNLLPTLNVVDNLLLPLELNGWSKEQSRQRIQELLEAIELPGHDTSYPDQLSGGEQQRVAVARALAHRPKLILADEPTGNLDAQSGKSVLNLLERMVREENSTMVLVTHSQAVASRADRTLTLADGKLQPASVGMLW